jgi:hypothetical protein
MSESFFSSPAHSILRGGYLVSARSNYDEEQNVKNVLGSVFLGVVLMNSVGCGPEAGQPVLSEEFRAQFTEKAGESEGTAGSEEGRVTAFAPAPNLWYLDVVGVCSDYLVQDYGVQCEDVRGLYTTIGDHGGAWMQVITEERGYRISGRATLGGSVLTEIGSQPIKDYSNTIIGWYRWWRADGHQSGQYVYRASSINAGPTLETFIQIQ